MSDVVVAADFGSSLGRAIFSPNSGYLKPELILFDPEVVDSALPLTLAMLGAIAQKRNLPETFSTSLGIVLPWSEYWTLDKEKTGLRNIYANLIGDNSSSISALFKAEKWLGQSLIE